MLGFWRNMKTSNLTSTKAIRYRHQQYDRLQEYIASLSADDAAALIELDRSRRVNTVFRRQGRTPDITQSIVRLALDEYLATHYPSDRES